MTHLYLKTKGRKRRDILVMLRRVLLMAGTARKKTSCLREDGWNERVWSWRERSRWSSVVVVVSVVRGWGPRAVGRWRDRVANDVGVASTVVRPAVGGLGTVRRRVCGRRSGRSPVRSNGGVMVDGEVAKGNKPR